MLVDAIGITSGHLERVHENQVGDSIDGTGTLLYGVFFQHQDITSSFDSFPFLFTRTRVVSIRVYKNSSYIFSGRLGQITGSMFVFGCVLGFLWLTIHAQSCPL